VSYVKFLLIVPGFIGYGLDNLSYASSSPLNDVTDSSLFTSTWTRAWFMLMI